MLKELKAVCRCFFSSTTAASAVEFALIGPVLLLLLAASVELSGAITAGNRATFVAQSIAQVVSQVKTTISAADMNGYIKSAALADTDIITYARATGKPLDQAVNVTISSVKFSPSLPNCASNCQYVANLVFSESLAGAKRPCGRLTEGAGQDMATLPSSLFASGSMVVVDVEVFYQPLMTTLLGSEISFKRQAYFRPRNVTQVNYEKNCPGVPSN